MHSTAHAVLLLLFLIMCSLGAFHSSASTASLWFLLCFFYLITASVQSTPVPARPPCGFCSVLLIECSLGAFHSSVSTASLWFMFCSFYLNTASDHSTPVPAWPPCDFCSVLYTWIQPRCIPHQCQHGLPVISVLFFNLSAASVHSTPVPARPPCEFCSVLFTWTQPRCNSLQHQRGLPEISVLFFLLERIHSAFHSSASMASLWFLFSSFYLNAASMHSTPAPAQPPCDFCSILVLERSFGAFNSSDSTDCLVPELHGLPQNHPQDASSASTGTAFLQQPYMSSQAKAGDPSIAAPPANTAQRDVYELAGRQWQLMRHWWVGIVVR